MTPPSLPVFSTAPRFSGAILNLSHTPSKALQLSLYDSEYPRLQPDDLVLSIGEDKQHAVDLWLKSDEIAQASENLRQAETRDLAAWQFPDLLHDILSEGLFTVNACYNRTGEKRTAQSLEYAQVILNDYREELCHVLERALLRGHKKPVWTPLLTPYPPLPWGSRLLDFIRRRTGQKSYATFPHLYVGQRVTLRYPGVKPKQAD